MTHQELEHNLLNSISNLSESQKYQILQFAKFLELQSEEESLKSDWEKISSIANKSWAV